MAAPLLSQKGWQMSSSAGANLADLTGTNAGASPSSDNFGIWWDGDVLREVVTGTKLDKYGAGRLISFYNYESAAPCNGTKDTPDLQADIFGDWREEYMLHSSDNTKLIIFTTTILTDYKIYTLMHDPVYRLSVASENVAYNQPPEPGVYIGYGMKFPIVKPNITFAGQAITKLEINKPLANSEHTSFRFDPQSLSITLLKPSANVTIDIYAINGKKIFNEKIRLRTGLTVIKLPAVKMKTGSYLLKTVIDGKGEIRKINIQK